MEYRPGKFLAAMRERASLENEQNVFTLSTDAGEMVFKQIAGLIARRVVSWKKPGERVARGETNRLGAIWFTGGCVGAEGCGDSGEGGR